VDVNDSGTASAPGDEIAHLRQELEQRIGMHRAALARSEERRQENRRLQSELAAARAEIAALKKNLMIAQSALVTEEHFSAGETAGTEHAYRLLAVAQARLDAVLALCEREEATHKPGRARYAALWAKDVRAAATGTMPYEPEE
jgi:hypothetical protein